jgi:hypothetical protein
MGDRDVARGDTEGQSAAEAVGRQGEEAREGAGENAQKLTKNQRRRIKRRRREKELRGLGLRCVVAV